MHELHLAKREVASWLCQNSKPQDLHEIEIFSQMCDNIKDLAEAEYYCTVVEAMEATENAGYNHNRYASGRYAPSGHGSHMGYNEDRYSSREGNYGFSKAMWDQMPEEYDPRFGQPWNDYMSAKRHYTVSHSESDKKMMDEHGMKHLRDFIDSSYEMYNTASPEMQKKMREDLNKLVNDLR